LLDTLNFLIQGLGVTIYISIFSFILGLVTATFFTLLRLFPGTWGGAIVSSYVEVFRGTPVLVQLLFIYFGLPALGVRFDPLTAGILALGLNSAAYQTEILRSAIKSIPKEQFLAAESLGLTHIQIYRHVILPQALRIALPSLVNEVIALIKESSLVSVIGVVELTRRGEYLVAVTFKAFEVFAAVAFIYFITCYTLSRGAKILERKITIPGYVR